MKKNTQTKKQRNQKVRKKKPTQQQPTSRAVMQSQAQCNSMYLAHLLTPPVVDGHFWVERDGVIIDPHFAHYNTVALIRGVFNKKNYCAAPADVQNYFIDVFHHNWMKRVKSHFFSIQPNQCCYNAFLEVERHGGKVVFGSMGFGSGKNIFWEYGNPNWKSVSNFIV